jgi:hypothetical protein
MKVKPRQRPVFRLSVDMEAVRFTVTFVELASPFGAAPVSCRLRWRQSETVEIDAPPQASR